MAQPQAGSSAPAFPAQLAGQLAPSPCYLTGEESLRLSSAGNAAGVTLTCAGRILGTDGCIRPFVFAHTPNSNRTIASTIENLSEGWLLGVAVKASAGTPTGGAVWAQLELVRGAGGAGVAIQALSNNFVTANSPLIWPQAKNLAPTDGAGNLRSIVGTQPAAGVEISETVPAGAQWELLAFHARLITSAVVNSREPLWIIDDGTNTLFELGDGATQAASLTFKHNLFQGGSVQARDSSNSYWQPLPIGLRMGAGYRIRTLTALLDAGDQWTQVNYLVKERFDV